MTTQNKAKDIKGCIGCMAVVFLLVMVAVGTSWLTNPDRLTGDNTDQKKRVSQPGAVALEKGRIYSTWGPAQGVNGGYDLNEKKMKAIINTQQFLIVSVSSEHVIAQTLEEPISFLRLPKNIFNKPEGW